MDDILKVILLSLVEGITEFLPISSTGHLIVGATLLNFEIARPVFEIFIQIGAVGAVMLHYRQTLVSHAAQIKSNPTIRRFWLLILLAFMPVAALGLLFAEEIEALLFSPIVIAISLIVGGLAFLLVERLPRFRQSDQSERHRAVPITQVTMSQAFTVGLVQILSLIPGMSRSGCSIIGGMLAGMNRQAATEFSFFLALPVLGAATVYKLLTSLNELRPDEWMMLGLGTALSGLFAWLAIGWLLKFVSSHSFVLFGYYRIAAGLVILVLAANRAFS